MFMRPSGDEESSDSETQESTETETEPKEDPEEEKKRKKEAKEDNIFQFIVIVVVMGMTAAFLTLAIVGIEQGDTGRIKKADKGAIVNASTTGIPSTQTPDPFCLKVSLKPISPPSEVKCPEWKVIDPEPPFGCHHPSDPLNKPRTILECWFTEKVFNTIFPKANQGWGPNLCRPYNYQSFIIASRYFPKFANDYVEKDPAGNPVLYYNKEEIFKRDLAGFFAHVIQESGENDLSLFQSKLSKKDADECYNRGGLYTWFKSTTGDTKTPEDAKWCKKEGELCSKDGGNVPWLFPCNKKVYPSTDKKEKCEGCYVGRGPIHLRGNVDYGLFSKWLWRNNITHQGNRIDLLTHPNLLLTIVDPPLAWLGSLWYYMTPQPPFPAMHDVLIGNWISAFQGYQGSVFGPTNIINGRQSIKDCSKDRTDLTNKESRRIKAFQWLTYRFGTPTATSKREEVTLSCSSMSSDNFAIDAKILGHELAYSWDYDKNAKNPKPCKCRPNLNKGFIYAYDKSLYPDFWHLNVENKKWCENALDEAFTRKGKKCDNIPTS